MADYSLAALEVEGFRGFNSKQKFPIDSRLTLVSGNNGVGKSSLLGSVEWCLYGDLNFIKYMDSKVRDELVNQSHPRGVATVTLSLRKGPDSYRIERSKELGTRTTHLALKSPSGQFEDELAEQEVYKLFGLTSDDFIRAVYLHQESVRGLLTDDPTVRDEALDRLFGLDQLRNLVEGIPIKVIRDEVQELDDKKEKLGEKIKGTLTQIQSDLSKLKEKAKELGLSEGDIHFEKAVGLCGLAKKRLTDFAREYALTAYPIAVPSEAAQLAGFERKVKTILREYETAVIEGTESSKAREQKNEINELLENRRKALDAKNDVEQSVSALSGSYDSPTKINVRLANLEGGIEELAKQRLSLDAHSRLIADAVQELEASKIQTCPVCNQRIDHGAVLSKLRTESERHLGEEVHQLDERKTRLEQEAKDLRSALDEFNEAINGLKESEDTISSIDMQLVKILAAELKDDELVLAASSKVQELQKNIAEAEKAYAKRAEIIQEIRQLMEQASAISEVLAKSSEFAEVNKHFAEESSQIQSIDSAVSELQKLERTLDTIIRAASEVQVGLASDMIKKAEADISSFYSRLVNHPYYDRIRVEVKPREYRGLVRNSYSIKAFSSGEGKETSVSSRFSTGQMNCVALAIYLALTRVLPVSLGFMMLDDPSQNLDPSHKKALASVLKGVLANRQVIVATQDAELISFLKSEVGLGTRYLFSDWGSNGPSIKVE